jgi:hypothetical protein
MKKLFTLLFLFIAYGLNAQRLSIGAEFISLPIQELSFSKPLIIDTAGYTRQYKFPSKLRNIHGYKQKGAGFDFHLNYFFRQQLYVGLGAMASWTYLNETGNKEGIEPDFLMKHSAYTLSLGLTKRRTVFRYLAEAGVGISRVRLSRLGEYGVFYDSHLNFNNWYLCSYAKIGMEWAMFRISLRSDLKLSTVKDNIGLKKFQSINAISVGLNLFNSGLLGKKHFRLTRQYVEREDEFKGKMENEIGTFWIEGGFSFSFFQLHLKGNGHFIIEKPNNAIRYIYLYTKTGVLNYGGMLSAKRSLSKEKNLFAGMQGGLNYTVDGSVIGKEYVYNVNVNDVPFKIMHWKGVVGAGYRYKKSAVTLAEFFPALEINGIIDMNAKDYQFYDWSDYFLSASATLTHKKKHHCWSLQVSKVLTAIDRAGLFQNGLIYNMTYSYDLFFRK